jgi:hypothetical protein
MRYELTDHKWAAIKPMLPNKPRGVPRVNDRRVLNGIFWHALVRLLLGILHALLRRALQQGLASLGRAIAAASRRAHGHSKPGHRMAIRQDGTGAGSLRVFEANGRF